MAFYKEIGRVDSIACLVILALMALGLAVLSSVTREFDSTTFLTPFVKKQLNFYLLGWGFFFFFASFPYSKLKSWTPFIYLALSVILLLTLFSTPIQNVHRWLRIPIVGMTLQSSEPAKLGLIVVLADFLERKGRACGLFSSACTFFIMVLVPFLLVAKQPDLGSALILFLVAFMMGYVGGIHPPSIKFISIWLGLCLFFVTLIFIGVLPHDKVKPYATWGLKEYQYERLNPDTYHQRASKTAIALGGILGSGWKKSEFSSKKWLPEAHSDSVFAAFAEEFGLFGVVMLLGLYHLLIYRTLATVKVARDRFGKLLASGVAIYLIMHILVNIAMMCGLIPITGVPLIFITSGGTSILVTMIALGIIQSIYTRRYTF